MLTEPLRFSTVTLPSGGALVTSTGPLRLVTETSPPMRSRVMLRLRVVRVTGPRASVAERSELLLIRDVAVEAGELEVGAAGVEFDGAADVLEVGVAEELAGHGDGTAEIGEGGVATAAFEGERAGDAVGGEGGVSVIDARGDGAGDGAELDVAVVGGDHDSGLDAADLDVAVVGGDGGRGGRGHGDGEVGTSAFDCGHARG